MTSQELLAKQLFAEKIRLETLVCVGSRGFGHLGGALSVVDALAVLYSGVMNIDPKNPSWKDRDKLVMSKGHAGPGLYATLALKGYFPLDWLKTLNQPGTHLPSHCDAKLTPGVDMTTGSLGQGFSTAIGLALAQKINGQKSRTYLFTGDGELNEGQCWEGAQFAPARKLSNLTWFVDFNKKQLDGLLTEVIDPLDIAAKARAFGWNALSVDGRRIDEIASAIEKAVAEKEKPTCIVLNTTKGQGVPLIENIELNHHIQFEGEILEKSIAYVKERIAALEKGGAK
ncbi:MAG: transketolase [Spirochaetaceae bacterium]|jgi:transketolase|nr:transketolase [Spirochaetaceae bacterium]